MSKLFLPFFLPFLITLICYPLSYYIHSITYIFMYNNIFC
nr:MAG TPA_asm: hypothetical protein [Caudoviricetes sp.]